MKNFASGFESRVLFEATLIKAVLVVMLVGFAGYASASVSGLPGQVVFHEKPVELNLELVNESAQAQPLSVEFAVVDFEAINMPKELAAGQSLNLKVILYPRDIAGETYKSKAIVSIGQDAYMKDIEFVFRKSDSCALEFFPSIVVKDNKITIDFAVKNNSVVPVKTKFLYSAVIPNDWFARPQGGELELQGLELAATQVNLTALSSFTGRGNFEFSCNDFTKNVLVDLDYSNPVEGAFSTGFLGLGSMADPGMVVNVVLAVLAAVLLISFISRFIKRLNEAR